MATMQAQIASDGATIGQLTTQINSVADCTGTSCVPRVPTCLLTALTGGPLGVPGLIATMSMT
jgi:hypothetical protein